MLSWLHQEELNRMTVEEEELSKMLKEFSPNIDDSSLLIIKIFNIKFNFFWYLEQQ